MAETTTPPQYSDKTLPVTPELAAYVRAQAGPVSAAQRGLIEATLALGDAAEMQIPVEQGALLTLLTRLVGARTVVEVGTFTGYSTLAIALGTDPDARITTCDITDRWSPIARRAWQEAGVADRITQLVGPAAESLAELPDEPLIDLVFIDADKVGYIGYWEQLVPRVRPGGLIIVDNVLYAGEAVSPDAVGNAAAIRAFNRHVLDDERVESVLLTVADGLTLARKVGGAR
ncbi:O-methyltransferase [Nocardia higoensis]|uniref:O-methyltransferase n=1 Tax=Nocardia higoensis TaxID=228599 RepID=UPI0002DF30E0|nr:class I SAM-dependent methyltransferase [Nocardia higoensis]